MKQEEDFDANLAGEEGETEETKRMRSRWIMSNPVAQAGIRRQRNPSRAATAILLELVIDSGSKDMNERRSNANGLLAVHTGEPCTQPWQCCQH